MIEARAAFAAAGCAVRLVVPGDDELFEVPTAAPPRDAVLSRGCDLAGLGILAATSALGVLAINSPQAIDVVRNKIAMQAVLLDHGLPLPKTWFAGSPTVFRSLARDRFPLVVKPFDGDGSRGIALLTRPSDVCLLPPLVGRRSTKTGASGSARRAIPRKTAGSAASVQSPSTIPTCGDSRPERTSSRRQSGRLRSSRWADCRPRCSERAWRLRTRRRTPRGPGRRRRRHEAVPRPRSARRRRAGAEDRRVMLQRAHDAQKAFFQAMPNNSQPIPGLIIAIQAF